MSRIALLAAAVLVLALPRIAPAWNSIGHMAIAKLAYDQLDDGTKLRVYELLKKHPHYETFLAAGRPAGVEEPEWVFMRAAIWPDWVRSRGEKDTQGATSSTISAFGICVCTTTQRTRNRSASIT